MARRGNRFGTLTPDNMLMVVAGLMVLMYFMCNSQQMEREKKSLFGGMGLAHHRGTPNAKHMMGHVPKNAQEVRDMSHQKPCMIVVYANWCGHCKNLKPEWNSMVENSRAHVVAVDSDKQPDVATQLGAQGYPTILGMKNGQTIPYEGDRKKDDLSAFAHRLH